MEKQEALVITDICPLYLEATDDELVDEVLYGMIVDIISPPKDGFVRVRAHYRYEGWAPQTCLLQDSDKIERWRSVPKWTVWSPYLDVKVGPSVHPHTIANVPRGGLLERLPEDETGDDGYIKIGLADGAQGWVRKPCVLPQATSWNKGDEWVLREKIVAAAKLYLGVQYRWGGKTPLGIDCSGLTSMAYMLCGSIIYRDADIRPGFDMREIPFGEKKPGDLVFFAHHVAMYLGGGDFIHSTANPSAVGVVINSFDPTSPVFRGDLLTSVVKTGTIF
ncbi:MAG: C40 family peptidase [Clostridiales bacterium]|jgi:hypothetical protein|nr:C40 family peptidase [Clostridiales bacterium]